MPFDPDVLLAGCAARTAASPHVTVHAPRVDLDLAPPTWEGFPTAPGTEAAWLLAYNAVNFCYWTEPRWFTVVDNMPVGADDEALGVMAAFARALQDGVGLDDPDWLEHVDEAAVARLLPPAPGAGPLPMLAERAAGLRALGRLYRTATPEKLVAQGSALRLVELLEAHGFDDRRGDLRFVKRAQLCAAMLHAVLDCYDDADRLTAFADYRLPQILRHLGLLELAPELAERIARGEEIPVGSDEETDLRAATVHAADLLRIHADTTALVVDHWLWRSAVAEQDRLPPFHRTRCTDY